jgi:hypothetical protein
MHIYLYFESCNLGAKIEYLGMKHVAFIDGIKSLLCSTSIYMPILMSQHNGMDSIKTVTDNH